ncbi:hypothetical protein [Streptobacillus felis]|uniref:hypothetical protein n=1 Tax=Streptobacillus felis TaxID=1384509 RepID=UPI000832B2AD|nr:hypothetical protein [Streptobacillus felis]
MSKMLEYIQGKIEKNKEERGNEYAGISKFAMYTDLGYKKDADFMKDLNELIESKKLFFYKREYTSLQDNGDLEKYSSSVFFTNIEKFVDYSSEMLNKNKEEAEKNIEKELDRLSKLSGLSKEAKYVYQIVQNELENKGFVDNKTILDKSKLLFNDFKEAQDELVNNKVLYLLKMEKENDKKYVFIKEDKYFARLIQAEKKKEDKIVEAEEIKEKEETKEDKKWKNKKDKNKEVERER